MNGEWTLNTISYGPKRVNLVQTGNYAEAFWLESIPGQPIGGWALRFTISGDSITGEVNNEPDPAPNNILNYRGTITTAGTYINSEVEYPKNSGIWNSYPLSKN